MIGAVTTSPTGTTSACSNAADETRGSGNVGNTKGGSEGSHDVNMAGALTTSPTGSAIGCSNAADATGGSGNVNDTKEGRGRSHDVNLAGAPVTISPTGNAIDCSNAADAFEVGVLLVIPKEELEDAMMLIWLVQ